MIGGHEFWLAKEQNELKTEIITFHPVISGNDPKFAGKNVNIFPLQNHL